MKESSNSQRGLNPQAENYCPRQRQHHCIVSFKMCVYACMRTKVCVYDHICACICKSHKRALHLLELKCVPPDLDPRI